jgi:hypothetical protein
MRVQSWLWQSVQWKVPVPHEPVKTTEGSDVWQVMQ